MAKIRVKTMGDPVAPKMIGDVVIPSGKTKSDIEFDLRDKLSELAVMGNALKPDDKKAIFSSLSATLGADKANKLMTHAYIFNSRPETQRLSPEEKLKSFYTIGSNDPDVMDVIGRTKNLGYGVIPGYRGSVSALNQAVQQGDYGTSTPINVNPEVQRRIRVKTSR